MKDRRKLESVAAGELFSEAENASGVYGASSDNGFAYNTGDVRFDKLEGFDVDSGELIWKAPYSRFYKINVRIVASSLEYSRTDATRTWQPLSYTPTVFHTFRPKLTLDGTSLDSSYGTFTTSGSAAATVYSSVGTSSNLLSLALDSAAGAILNPGDVTATLFIESGRTLKFLYDRVRYPLLLVDRIYGAPFSGYWEILNYSSQTGAPLSLGTAGVDVDYIIEISELDRG